MSELKRIEERITKVDGYQTSSGQIFDNKVDALLNENAYQLQQNINATIGQLVEKPKHKKIISKFMKAYISEFFDDFTNACEVYAEINKME